jgi:hypothetical protein
MLSLNLFIAGMEKSGTTSLADWLVSNKVATYLVPGMKEPYAFASDHFKPSAPQPHEVVLDASTGYALNPATLARMPEHNTKIILCVRNYFDRCFSAYTFYRTTVRRDERSIELLESIPDHLELARMDARKTPAKDFLFEHFFRIYKIHAPAKSEATIRKYYELQASQIMEQTFPERVRYEIAFFLSRRQLPLFSILSSSFLTTPLKNLLNKYRPEDIHLVTIGKLNDPILRRSFIEDLVGHSPNDLTDIPSLNTTRSDARTEFEKPELAELRYYFETDFEFFSELVAQHSVSTKYVDMNDLNPSAQPRRSAPHD